jgi:hypothetical protein
VGQPGSESVDELIKHELAIHQAVFVSFNFFREVLEELGLDPAECLSRGAATPRQFGVGILPLTQFLSPLSLGRTQLMIQFFQELILLFLICHELPQEGDNQIAGIHFTVQVTGRGVSRHINAEHGKLLRIGAHTGFSSRTETPV